MSSNIDDKVMSYSWAFSLTAVAVGLMAIVTCGISYGLPPNAVDLVARKIIFILGGIITAFGIGGSALTYKFFHHDKQPQIDQKTQNTFEEYLPNL